VKNTTNWPLPFANASDVGMSVERLARIGPALQIYIDKQKVPNFVSLIARHGKIVYFENLGYIDVESRKPVQKDTIFRTWSNTKTISGVGTMICVEDGLLSLDDPVSKYIPAFKNQKVRVDDIEWLRVHNCPRPIEVLTVPAQREVTVRDCLRNTTGLTQGNNTPIQYLSEFKGIIEDSGLLDSPSNQPHDIRKMVEAWAKLPLADQPGTKFAYHAGYPALGLVLEAVTGKSLEEFYIERIFKPLGMTDTTFYLPKEKLSRFSTCYQPDRNANKLKMTLMERPDESERFKGPRTYFDSGGGCHGGVISTVPDYARFAQMLLNGGELDGTRIVSRKSVELMTSSQTGDVYMTTPGPSGYGFGLGVSVYKGGNPAIRRSPGTYGWTGGGGTLHFNDPKEDLFFIIFTQTFEFWMIPDNDFQEKFERLVYEALI
jgi:CubicO group peptidase (beta-lactamase class C family)